MGTEIRTEPLTAEEKRAYNARWGLPPDACNCHHGSARYCSIHTQADYEAARSSTPLDDPRVLPDNMVCACFDETGTRTVRKFIQCQRCKAFMCDDDYASLPAPLDDAWREAEEALPEDWGIKLEGAGRRDDFYTAIASYAWSLRHYRDNVGKARFTPFEMDHGPTPAAALRALAETLRNRETGS
jgi:hypothetical protein